MVKVDFEPTPNPATLKFHLHQKVTDTPVNAATAFEAEASPLAAKIFGFPWTAGVYVGTDFVTVTKHDWVDWNVLATPLAGLIQEHLERGEPVISKTKPVSATDFNDNDSPLDRKIKEALNREIRPVVALDGGDIVFNKFEDGILHLHMRGACSGCPSSAATLKDGVEVRMKELFPEIREVRAD